MLGWLRIRPRQAVYVALKRFVEEVRDGQPTSDDVRVHPAVVPDSGMPDPNAHALAREVVPEIKGEFG